MQQLSSRNSWLLRRFLNCLLKCQKKLKKIKTFGLFWGYFRDFSLKTHRKIDFRVCFSVTPVLPAIVPLQYSLSSLFISGDVSFLSLCISTDSQTQPTAILEAVCLDILGHSLLPSFKQIPIIIPFALPQWQFSVLFKTLIDQYMCLYLSKCSDFLEFKFI